MREAIKAASIDQMEDELIQEISDGIDGSGIRPGNIGEIGTGSPIEPREERMLRAAGRAQKQSGLAVTVHVHALGLWGNRVLDILADERVKRSRIILDHIDAALMHLDIDIDIDIDIDFDQGVAYVESLLTRGCFVEFDLCGNSHYFRTSTASWWLSSDRERCRAMAKLVQAGYGKQLLLSQDVGHKHNLQSYGGWRYGHVLGEFFHHMREAGISDAQISQFFIENPAAVLAL